MKSMINAETGRRGAAEIIENLLSEQLLEAAYNSLLCVSLSPRLCVNFSQRINFLCGRKFIYAKSLFKK